MKKIARWPFFMFLKVSGIEKTMRHSCTIIFHQIFCLSTEKFRRRDLPVFVSSCLCLAKITLVCFEILPGKTISKKVEISCHLENNNEKNKAPTRVGILLHKASTESERKVTILIEKTILKIQNHINKVQK